MSKMNFSKGKFSKFISSKGFYVAIAVCLLGAGAATWLAVDRTITGIEDNNTQMIESENQWNDYPQLEEAEKKQPGVKTPSATTPSPSASSSSAQSSSSEPASKPAVSSELSEAPAKLPDLAYVLPVKAEIINPFSNGELVKNMTLGDWRTHDGVDIAAEQGTDVLAAADGTVTSVRTDALWGTVVTIDHADGNQTIYCGLDKVTPVKEGDTVLVKQVIGRVDGVPCEISQPNHLHFAMKRDGQWVDPLSVMEKQVG